MCYLNMLVLIRLELGLLIIGDFCCSSSFKIFAKVSASMVFARVTVCYTKADGCGFESLWLPRYDSYSFDSLSIFAAAAGATNKSEGDGVISYLAFSLVLSGTSFSVRSGNDLILESETSDSVWTSASALFAAPFSRWSNLATLPLRNSSFVLNSLIYFRSWSF